MARAAVYKGKKGSGVTVNGKELQTGGVVTVPRSLVDYLLTRKGWNELGVIDMIEPEKEETNGR